MSGHTQTNQLVRINTLKAGQLVQITKGRIYVLVQLVEEYGLLRAEVAECGRKKVDTVRSRIDANTMVSIVEADFFIGLECVHRTYKDEDDEMAMVMPEDRSTGSPQPIRRCRACQRAIPSTSFAARCKGCERSFKKRHRRRNLKAPGVDKKT